MMTSPLCFAVTLVIFCTFSVHALKTYKKESSGDSNYAKPQPYEILKALAYKPIRETNKSMKEKQIQVSSTEVMCPDGRWKIHRDWLCDGFPDCQGAWDENPAVCRAQPCPEDWVQCGDGVKCLRPWRACDGHDHCGDNSDESPELCENRSCYRGNEKCHDGRQCVPVNFFCDGHIDCEDGSDERPEVCRDISCTSGLVRCPSGKCIFRAWSCDGKEDCDDGYDEHPDRCNYVDNLPIYIT